MVDLRSAIWVISFLILAVLVEGDSPAVAESQTNFVVRRGVNVAGPFLMVQSADPHSGRSSKYRGIENYLANVVNFPGCYTPRCLKDHKFDHVRLLVNPAPLLDNPDDENGLLYEQVMRGVNAYNGAGLRVIVTYMIREPIFANKVTASSDSEEFSRFRRIVGEMAQLLAAFPQGRVALEPLNEPPDNNCAEHGWLQEQQILLADIRKKAKTLPILISGCNYGQAKGISGISKENVDFNDFNLIFSIHYYEPMVFTHQGSHFPEFKFIDEIYYPATPTAMPTAIDRSLKNIGGANLPSADALKARLTTSKYLSQYFIDLPNAKSIDDDFGKVAEWARENGVTSDRIILGEFAALNWRKTDSEAYRESRAQWNCDVVRFAEEHGYAWSYLNLVAPFGDPIDTWLTDRCKRP